MATEQPVTIIQGSCMDVLPTLEAGSVNCVVTSPPYWGLRDYGTEGQLGLEPTPRQYVENLVGVFRELRRVLRDDGTVWLNLGDSYAGGKQGNDSFGDASSGLNNGRGGVGNKTGEKMRTTARKPPAGMKAKDLVGIPWRAAFALQADGWWLRSDIIWSKPNPMPESVQDRPTRAHEYVFLLSKSARYWYDGDAIREPYNEASLSRYNSPLQNTGQIIGARQPGGVWAPENVMMEPNPKGRNKRTVWEIATQPFPGAHFATFPETLVKPCILAGCPEGGTVLDPFAGSGTVGVVARKAGRRAVLIELNAEYCGMMRERMAQAVLL